MKLRIAWIGKTKDAAIASLTGEYLRRLEHYAEVESVVLKDESALLRREPNSRPKPVLVLLDARGRQMSSEELAKFLGDHQERNPAPLAFAIGPANGFSDETRRSAARLLSLGKMTMPHELARIVLLEQLYRGFTILKRHPYHLAH